MAKCSVVLSEPVRGVEAPANQIVLFHVAGELADHAEDDGAVGNRDAAYAWSSSRCGPDSPPADAKRTWVRDAWETMRQYSTGGNYVNFQTDDETDERTRPHSGRTSTDWGGSRHV